tara:strand:- start:4003 stop:5520 length:1518 start_codon:yes stop_codon:yes gene_type:complete
MPEIASPIGRSINAIRRTFSSSLFSPAATAPAPAQPDPKLVQLIVRNTNAVNSVTVQLTNVSNQVSVLTSSLNSISQSLALNAQLDQQRANAELNRQQQLAQLKLREGKESQIEKKMQDALIKPIAAVAQKASNILGALSQYFTTILFGWLGTQSLEYLRALATGNEEMLKKIQSTIVNGLWIAGGLFIGVNVAITALTLALKGLAKRLLNFTFRKLIKAPFVSLINVFRNLAGASLLGGGIMGGIGKNIRPPVTDPSKILPGKQGFFGKLGNFLKGGTAYGMFDAGMDVMGGKNPIGAITDSAGGVYGSRVGGNMLGKFLPNKLKWLAPILGFMGGKTLTEGARTSLTGDLLSGGGDNQQQGAQPEWTKEQKLEWANSISGGNDVSLDTPSEEKKEGNRGLLGWRSSLDWMTGGLTDFDKKGSDFNLINNKSQKTNQLKEADLSLAEPAPELVAMGGGDGSQGQDQSISSGTGSMGGSVPRIPSSNNDNNYIFNGLREYQIAPA